MNPLAPVADPAVHAALAQYRWDDGLMQLALDHVPDLVFIKDAQSRFLYANQAFLGLYPPEKRNRILGFTTAEDFPREQVERFLEQDRRAFALGNSQVVEEITALTGEVRTFETRKIRFETRDGEPRLLAIAHDITELVARERSLAALNGKLQHFSAMAAHDLRSPLATFISTLERIQDDPQSHLSPRSRERMGQMIASASNLLDNITSLLNATKAEHGSAGIEFARVDMNLLLADVRFNLQKAIADAGAQVLAPRLPAIIGHEPLLRQLLQNLIENSIKYADPNRSLQVTIQYQLEGTMHTFSVEDNGPGIAAGAAQKMFALFEQQSDSSSGAGIGLALCNSIVRLHQGSIRVDSEFQGGCRIVFAIPTTLRASEPSR